jgi:FixJ family two-component response regulator
MPKCARVAAPLNVGEDFNLQGKAHMISIIDDDPSIREATKGLMRSLGYATAIFSSAEEFLQSGRVTDTSCVISDIKMPGMNGIELQSHLTAKGHCVPIIFVTAFPEERMRKRAMEAGALCFLSKPFSEERLIECLDRALTEGRRDH